MTHSLTTNDFAVNRAAGPVARVRPSAGRAWQDEVIVSQRASRRRSRTALLTLLGLALAATGCRERGRRPAKVPFATQAAYGRPETCPEGAVSNVYGDRMPTPSPMDLRCSYADGTGSVLTRVRGRVVLEGPAGSPGEAPGRVTVALYKVPPVGQALGPELGHAVTDPQGTFSLGVMLRPGEMLLVVPDPDGGPPLVQQRLVVGGDAGHRIEGVRIVIPRPMDEEPEPEGAVELGPRPSNAGRPGSAPGGGQPGREDASRAEGSPAPEGG